jgi:methyl-accepting chemotaxis protein
LIRFKSLRLTTKLFLLVSICLIGFAAFAIVAWRTLDEVQVNGPVYKRVVQGKDVIADVLPPPEYIIESYLLVLQMVEEPNPELRAELIERSRKLRSEYDTRHEVWVRELPPGPLREALLEQS